MQMFAFLVLLAGACLAAPSSNPSIFASNLAYRSPSLTVPELEVSLHDVHARMRKRNNGGEYYTGNLTFPYGVASGVRILFANLGF